MKPKNIPMIRLTEEEYQILQTKKLIMQTNTITETVKKCIFEGDFLKDLANLLIENNKLSTLILRQNYITIKFCSGIFMEMAKKDEFRKPAEEIHLNFIDEYFEIAKKEAEAEYK